MRAAKKIHRIWITMENNSRNTPLICNKTWANMHDELMSRSGCCNIWYPTETHLKLTFVYPWIISRPSNRFHNSHKSFLWYFSGLCKIYNRLGSLCQFREILIQDKFQNDAMSNIAIEEWFVMKLTKLPKRILEINTWWSTWHWILMKMMFAYFLLIGSYCKQDNATNLFINDVSCVQLIFLDDLPFWSLARFLYTWWTLKLRVITVTS